MSGSHQFGNRPIAVVLTLAQVRRLRRLVVNRAAQHENHTDRISWEAIARKLGEALAEGRRVRAEWKAAEARKDGTG